MSDLLAPVSTYVLKKMALSFLVYTRQHWIVANRPQSTHNTCNAVIILSYTDIFILSPNLTTSHRQISPLILSFPLQTLRVSACTRHTHTVREHHNTKSHTTFVVFFHVKKREKKNRKKVVFSVITLHENRVPCFLFLLRWSILGATAWRGSSRLEDAVLGRKTM